MLVKGIFCLSHKKNSGICWYFFWNVHHDREVFGQHDDFESDMYLQIWKIEKAIERCGETTICFMEYTIFFKMMEMMLKSMNYEVILNVDNVPIFCGYYFKYDPIQTVNELLRK